MNKVPSNEGPLLKAPKILDQKITISASVLGGDNRLTNEDKEMSKSIINNENCSIRTS